MPASRRPRYPKLSALAAPWTTLEWWAACKSCGHESRIPAEGLHRVMARLGGGVAARDAKPRLVCSQCGGRNFRTDVVRGTGGQAQLGLGGTLPAQARRADPPSAVEAPARGRQPRMLTAGRFAPAAAQPQARDH